MNAVAYRWRWVGLLAVLAASLMNLLDVNILNIAAPTIRHDLGGSYTDLQWLTAGYTLAMALGLLTGGRLGDMYGRKRMLLLGAAGFTLASLACSVAPSEGVLITARIAQGLVGAVMVPQGFGLIRDMFPPQDVGKAFGVFGPAIGIATILGPILAGFLIHLDGWRLIFLISVPLGIAAIALGARFLPAVPPADRDVRLDLTGTALAGTAMFLLVFFGAVVGISLTIGLLLQIGLGYTPEHASLISAAWAIGAFVGTGASAGLSPKLGRAVVHIGLIVMTCGLAGVYLVLSHTHTALSGWALSGPLLAYGAGMGMIFLPLYDIIIADVEDREVGSAAGVLEAVQQLGGSLGVAVMGTIFFSVMGSAVATHRADSLHAAQVTTLATIAATALAFGIGFLLPRYPRPAAQPVAESVAEQTLI